MRAGEMERGRAGPAGRQGVEAVNAASQRRGHHCVSIEELQIRLVNSVRWNVVM